jgi:hypothetical protein
LIKSPPSFGSISVYSRSDSLPQPTERG